MIVIKLFGELAERFTPEFKAHVHTTREAVECMCINFAGFREYLLDAGDTGVVFKAIVGDSWELGTPDEVFQPIPQNATISITPVIAGSGRIGKIIAGVALLGLGIAGVGLVGLTAFQVGMLGGLLLVQGLFGGQVNAPDPNEEDEKSFIFSGPTNTIAQGNRMSIVLGSILVGSQIISASITTYSIPGS